MLRLGLRLIARRPRACGVRAHARALAHVLARRTPARTRARAPGSSHGAIAACVQVHTNFVKCQCGRQESGAYLANMECLEGPAILHWPLQVLSIGGVVMAMRELADFAAGLIAEAGVSGHEREVAALARREMSGLFDDARQDALGNLILLKRGLGRAPHPRVMLAAHMDEIGLMVTKIEDQGCLRVTEVGGIDRRILPGLEVVVHGKRDLPGVIGAKPPHVQEPDERKKSVKWEDLFVDVGLTAAEARELVEVGDAISFAGRAVRLQGQLLAGKALDDRAGVAVMFECLKELAHTRHHADVYCVATVQEEVGIRGATTSTYGIVPDVGIAIDVTHGDMLGVPEHETLPLGRGPAVAIGPQVHPALYDRLKEIADELDIDVQVEPSASPRGTDAFAMQVTRGGIPTALVSVPLRYMHTAVETVCLSDVKKAGRLLAEFVVRLDKKFVEGLRCF